MTLEKRGKMAGEAFGKAVMPGMDYLLRAHVQDLEHFTRFMMERDRRQVHLRTGDDQGHDGVAAELWQVTGKENGFRRQIYQSLLPVMWKHHLCGALDGLSQ